MFKLNQKKTMEYSKIDWKTFKPGPVAGVDEVGRGCLAGPVMAAAVIFNSELISDDIKDSKLLSEKRRSELAISITNEHLIGIGSASVEEIDRLNILKASLLAMKRAVENLPIVPGHILIDGIWKIPDLREDIVQSTIVKGDLRVSLISAASIVAKVARDDLMKKIGREFPEYGISEHKGYSTKAHKEAISKYGPTNWHRKSFSGVKEYLLGPS